MTHNFEKYHGAGNDFILLDSRKQNIELSSAQIAALCHRRYGIGGDGLILLKAVAGYDFEMKYFNSDGAPGSMCGNGGRCAVSFAAKHGIIRQSARFVAFDGVHEALFTGINSIRLSMSGVQGFEKNNGDYILDSGSPHYIQFVNDAATVDVITEGKKIRNSKRFSNEGINVNFVAMNGEVIHMRTYERGVEDETFSCGTGTVAAAIACGIIKNKMGKQEYTINAIGGVLKISFDRTSEDTFQDVWLEGPVAFVFAGSVQI